MANPSNAMWDWFLSGVVAAEEVRAALAEALARPVVSFDVADPAELPDAILCDVWYTEGDFSTSVLCCQVSTAMTEVAVAASVARQINRHCLLPDDTFDPSRYLLVSPDGTLRPVHVTIEEADDGETLSNPSLCTYAAKACRSEVAQCWRSRWAPDSVIAGLSAA